MTKIYTVNPGIIGSIVSRPPNPVKNAEIVLKGNDLYVEWVFNDVAQPGITQIIFNQVGGAEVNFLISNYMKSFKVPYEKFAMFTAGHINVQISQAFSRDESAYSKTSSFSAPAEIFFKATNHHFIDNK